jgi:methyltransferase
MTLPGWVCWLLLCAVAIERAAELPIAKRNTAALLARGGVEHGAAHYPFIIALHALWLAALAAWLLWRAPALRVPWAVVYVALQPVRLWVLQSLGPYWTTRIITMPGASLVRRGPYRFLKHPNYAVVVAEIALLPLAFAAWPLALVFSILNAAILTVRLQAENAVLRERASPAATPARR